MHWNENSLLVKFSIFEEAIIFILKKNSLNRNYLRVSDPLKYFKSFNSLKKENVSQILGFKKHLNCFFCLSGTVSICTLATLSVHRLMSVKNVSQGMIGSCTKALAVVIFIWAYTCTISIPPFFGIGAYVPETSGMS